MTVPFIGHRCSLLGWRHATPGGHGEEGPFGGQCQDLQGPSAVETNNEMVDFALSYLLSQGQALDQHAKKSVKVLVVGNPANTNALIAAHYAPSIPKENFSAMTRLSIVLSQAFSTSSNSNEGFS